MDPWEKGVQRHLASLTPAERTAFMIPATADDCMANIQVVRHRNRQSYRKMIEAIVPLIPQLRRFEGAIDGVYQLSPRLPSPVWGPVRAVITVGASTLRDSLLWCFFPTHLRTARLRPPCDTSYSQSFPRTTGRATQKVQHPRDCFHRQSCAPGCDRCALWRSGRFLLTRCPLLWKVLFS